jgi:hypothetical protein
MVPGTQVGHIRACKRFAAWLKRSPETATADDLRAFQLHLSETGVSACTRNRTMTGLRFLFRVTLRRLDLLPEMYHIKEPQKVPLILSQDEARRLLAMSDNVRNRLLLSIGYGAGLRAGEVVRLKVKHMRRNVLIGNLSIGLLVASVDAPRNAHVCFGMLDQNHVDDLRVRTDRLMSYLHDIPNQICFLGLGKTGCDVAFDERHVSVSLLQTCDEAFVVDVAFDELGKMLAVFDKIDPATLSDHEEDIVRRLTRRLADNAKQASGKRTFLLIGPTVAHIA